MKILDAAAIIAIFNEINCPNLIDKVLELGHDLVIPSRIMKSKSTCSQNNSTQSKPILKCVDKKLNIQKDDVKILTHAKIKQKNYTVQS